MKQIMDRAKTLSAGEKKAIIRRLQGLSSESQANLTANAVLLLAKKVNTDKDIDLASLTLAVVEWLMNSSAGEIV